MIQCLRRTLIAVHKGFFDNDGPPIDRIELFRLPSTVPHVSLALKVPGSQRSNNMTGKEIFRCRELDVAAF